MSLDMEEKTVTDYVKSECTPDLKREFKTQYRLVRRKISAFLREYLKKSFTNVLFVTVEEIPVEYILSLQKQYPDKIIKILTLHTSENANRADLVDKYEYSLKNDSYICELYEYQNYDNNIQVYGISSNGLENIKYKDEVYKFCYLAHFCKCVRIVSKKLKADIIHSENIPFFLGAGFNNERSYFKLIQTFHHYPIFDDIEPFWAAVNLADKKNIKRILKDKTIKKNLAALFGIRTPKGSTQIKSCLEYIYKNFEEFRKNIDKEEIVNENILIKRLNDRIIKIFPQAFAKGTDMYNPIFYTAKQAEYIGFNASSSTFPEWIESINILKRGYVNSYKNKVMYPIDKNNFREAREKNKKYLIKEFESERIQTKFTDLTLFDEEKVEISGYLDYFYRGVLIFAPFNRYSSEDEIKAVSLAVLKCFEQRKNIQIIFNVPKDFDNKYFQSLVEYMKNEKAIRGKWLLLEGKINIPQFTSSADIVLLPNGNFIGAENILYASLKNGCIPIISSEGACSDIITDIYDDMNAGCGFKAVHNEQEEQENFDKNDLYTKTLFKALSFHLLNSAGWKKLIENALEYDSSWNFELIEQYNSIYNDVI